MQSEAADQNKIEIKKPSQRSRGKDNITRVDSGAALAYNPMTKLDITWQCTATNSAKCVCARICWCA